MLPRRSAVPFHDGYDDSQKHFVELPHAVKADCFSNSKVVYVGDPVEKGGGCCSCAGSPCSTQRTASSFSHAFE